MKAMSLLQASQWYRCPKFVSARETTVASGIADLLSGAAIDDYLFDPCGYSMNGLEGSAFSTIHVTPEDGFSYASVELTGYKLGTLDRDHIAAKVPAYLLGHRISCLALTPFLSGSCILGYAKSLNALRVGVGFA